MFDKPLNKLTIGFYYFYTAFCGYTYFLNKLQPLKLTRKPQRYDKEPKCTPPAPSVRALNLAKSVLGHPLILLPQISTIEIIGAH